MTIQDRKFAIALFGRPIEGWTVNPGFVLTKIQCRTKPPGDPGLMQIPESIQCPFCGQLFELMIDTSVSSQRFTTDCEVCCRPFEVSAECEPGEILCLDVQSG